MWEFILKTIDITNLKDWAKFLLILIILFLGLIVVYGQKDKQKKLNEEVKPLSSIMTNEKINPSQAINNDIKITKQTAPIENYSNNSKNYYNRKLTIKNKSIKQKDNITEDSKKSINISADNNSSNSFENNNFNGDEIYLKANNNSHNSFKNTNFNGQNGSVGLDNTSTKGNLKVKDSSIEFEDNSSIIFNDNGSIRF